MKKLCCILMMLFFAFPAFAQENPFAPFSLTAPEGVVLEENEGTFTFVSGLTRVVAMVIDRVPDEDPEAAVIRLMGQFEPDAALEDDFALANGYAGLSACSTDKFGDGVNQWTMMVLSPAGDLLILSGYDLDGNEEKVHALLDALLASLTADDTALVTK